MLKKIFFSLITLVFLSCLGVIAGLYWLVVLHPGPEVEIDNIKKILGKESHVFYSDGTTKLGVFFDTNHRQYVAYNKIPSDFVNALVAAEDSKFFGHFGFDPVGITRAAIKNFQAGRVVQGGSTLTQQTAKNLFKRRDRSIEAKLKELLFALRLEYRYPKEMIFEFYANQFYVSGNGHGLGVAARYYFNKKAEDLTLIECAFIAGSVKKPNAYNPFIKKTDEQTKAAIEEGKIRANYVLQNMFELEMIGLGRYREEMQKEIVFNKGEVGYSLDYAMEMVKEAVSAPEVLEALDIHGISNVATSGVRVITSVEKEVQQYALEKLRHELSRLDIRLRGYERDEVQKELRALKYKGDSLLRKGAFLFGIIEEIKFHEKKVDIKISLGRKHGEGIVDRKGISTAVTAYSKWKKNLWSEPKESDLTQLISNLKVGDRVWTSVLDIVDGDVKLSLERYPKVQGGALVLHEGAIQAVVGGSENRFFNRALDAKRTMGSSFKPFLFAAAVQLGWNTADILQNKRELFLFQNQAYFPRPDHSIKSERVSMSWAGVHSENVASIWLAAHLCDRLSLDQFKEVAAHVDMLPRKIDEDIEPYRTFKSRVQRKYGIVVNRASLQQAAFKQAVKNLETDFIFEDMTVQYQRISNMHYGFGFERFIEEIDSELEDGSKNISSSKRKELSLRKKILANDYLTLSNLYKDLKVFKNTIADPLSFFSVSSDIEAIPLAELYYDNSSSRYVFVKVNNSSSSMQKVNHRNLQEYLLNRSPTQQQNFWEQVYLDATLSIAAFDLLQNQVDREYTKLKKQLPYSFETLANVDDYRIMVGLHYLIKFAQELGVESKLEPVLSFPLGSNVVSLYETVRVYEGLATGKVNFVGKSVEGVSNPSLAIIDRIESAEGKIIYEPEREMRNVIDKKTSVAVGHILENIVKFGTGRYADKNVKLAPRGGNDAENFEDFEVNVPLLGKTGTANRYTNASFFGYLPGLSKNEDGVALEDGYTIGVYVGYDDNKVMRKSSTKITGSAGALPTWTGIVNKLLAENRYGEKLDPVELSFTGLPLTRPELGQMNLKVDKDLGGVPAVPATFFSETSKYSPSILTFGMLDSKGKFVKGRHFEPYWRVRENN